MPKRATAVTALALLVSAGCDDCFGPELDAGPPGSASGTVVIDGNEELYSVDVEASKLIVITGLNLAQIGCGVFHFHAVEAKSYSADFRMDQADPGGSTWTFEVPAAGLEPDDPENRAMFPQTADVMLSEGDRKSIMVSVLDELRAEDHPIVTFAARDFTTFEGEGTATLDVTINGRTSELELAYEASFGEDDVIRVTGEGVIDGTQHEIPNPDGVFSDCIASDMPLHLDMVVRPGGGDGPPPAPDAGPPFEETYFPWDAGCPDDNGYDSVVEIFGRRCLGCHSDPPRLGASSPLVTWEDFRVDTARNVGRPLYEVVAEYVQLDIAESLHMPPAADVTQLNQDELGQIVGWANAGGPPEACTPIDTPAFTHVPQSTACGTYGFEEDIKGLFVSGNDAGVADDGGMNEYEDGLPLTDHPYFMPLNLWETAYERMKDGSMPPGGGVGAAELARVEAWIAEGYPETRCP
jgi:hypothetical protein